MNDKREKETVNLLKKAELLMEFRDYEKGDLREKETAIDIIAAESKSEETVLMRVITKSRLKSGAVGVELVRTMKENMEGQKVDKAILFANRFTSAAKREMREEGIEFFSNKQNIVSSYNPQELYLKIHEYVDALCQIKCGFIPKTKHECKGFSKNPIGCSFCGGSGKIPSSPNSYWKQRCPVCGGVGSKENHYSCKIRLLSDNADFHFGCSWAPLLQNDLLSLVEIMWNSEFSQEESPSIQLRTSLTKRDH